MSATRAAQAGVSVQGLRVVFDRFVAVDDVSFEVEPGGSFGIVGESGSGKSTVLRAICSLTPLAAGQVALTGVAAPALPASKAFRRQVQMVFQDPYACLHPRQTVDRLLAEPLAIHGIGRPEEREARIEQALDEVGLGQGFRFRYPHQLSGGQRQRIAIARALILEPRFLLLDEPTSALDVSVQAEILNLLSRLRRELGLTLLMVSHDLAVIAHLCDRIAVMNRGEIVESTTADALAAGNVRNPYTQQLLRSNKGFDASGEALDLLDAVPIR